MNKTANETHRQIHKRLHKAFDELAADFLSHNSNRLLSKTTIMELIEWSYTQTINPEEPK